MNKNLLWKALLIVGLVVYLGLPFTPIGPSGMNMYIAGFSKYVRANADIEGIRDWLDTLDPEDFVEYSRYDNRPTYSKELQGEEWPEVIANIKPRYVRLSLDNDNKPQVRLNWGSGFLGTWGFVVGNENLPTPASDLSWGGEYRQEMYKGVYAFYGIH